MRPSTAAATAVLALVATSSMVQAIENGFDRPILGWNSWGQFKCNFNETIIRQVADALVETGLRDAGYTYLNLDDCWMAPTRDANGRLQADPVKFPSGMKALGEYLHSKGLKFGIYSSAGTATCQGLPASLGKEIIDAATFAAWEVDYLKYDNCNYLEGGQGEVAVTFNLIPPTGRDQRFPAMRDALNATGRPIFYSVCNWGQERVYQWGANVGNSFRVTGDIASQFHGELNPLTPGLLNGIIPQVPRPPLPTNFSKLPSWARTIVSTAFGGLGQFQEWVRRQLQNVVDFILIPSLNELFGNIQDEISNNGRGQYEVTLPYCWCVTKDCHNPGFPNLNISVSSNNLWWPLNKVLDFDFKYSTNDWYFWGGNCSVLNILDRTASIETGISGPGGFMDLDHLVVGVKTELGSLNLDQARSHFSLWSAFKSPLVVTSDIRTLSEQDKRILTNREVIAVNQDPLGVAVKLVNRVAKSPRAAPVDTYAGPLADGSYVVIMLNRKITAETATIQWSNFANYTWAAINKSPIKGRAFTRATVRDLWAETPAVKIYESGFSALLQPDASVMIKVTPMS